MKRNTFPLLLFLLCTLPIEAGIYRWTDAQGNLHFGDRPPDTAQSEEVEVTPNTYSAPPQAAADDGAAEPEQAGKAKSVVMYSATWCGYCRAAKSYFRSQGIHFQEYDVERTERGRSDFARYGSPGLPLIFCGGKRMVGFSAASFEATCRRG